jgi:D-arabinose 1-dehydrogenase-like Zn-dependent alcohol dehydrogenase
MAKMKAAQLPKAGANFQIVERDIPEPGPGHVRIRVQACGACHSDARAKEGSWPGLAYPRVPGHEVAGVIDQACAGVTQWEQGQRVGVGWHGGQDGTCLACRRRAGSRGMPAAVDARRTPSIPNLDDPLKRSPRVLGCNRRVR